MATEAYAGRRVADSPGKLTPRTAGVKGTLRCTVAALVLRLA
jgi:hypothetical protein